MKHETRQYKALHMMIERSQGGNTVKNDTYGEPLIIEKNNIRARFYSPILTEEEYNRRMEQIKQATIRLLLSIED